MVDKTDTSTKVIKAEVPTTTSATLPRVVSMYIGAVMEAPTAMKAMEDAVKLWLQDIPQESRNMEAKQAILQQLVRGRQVMESLHSLIYQGYQVY